MYLMYLVFIQDTTMRWNFFANRYEEKYEPNSGRMCYTYKIFDNSDYRAELAEVITEAVHELQSNINMRSVLSELSHPDDAVIHIENACAILSKLWIENKKVYGEFEVLEKMPKGSMLKSLIEQNVSLFISSRGVGDMETCIKEGNEYDKVLPGFKFVTFDVVIDPSVKGTKLSISESKAKNKKVVFEQKLLDTLKKTLV